jgi:hypothetical protein
VEFLSDKRRKLAHTDYSASILDRPLVEEKVENHEYRSESDIRFGTRPLKPNSRLTQPKPDMSGNAIYQFEAWGTLQLASDSSLHISMKLIRAYHHYL